VAIQYLTGNNPGVQPGLRNENQVVLLDRSRSSIVQSVPSERIPTAEERERWRAREREARIEKEKERQRQLENEKQRENERTRIRAARAEKDKELQAAIDQNADYRISDANSEFEQEQNSNCSNSEFAPDMPQDALDENDNNRSITDTSKSLRDEVGKSVDPADYTGPYQSKSSYDLIPDLPTSSPEDLPEAGSEALRNILNQIKYSSKSTYRFCLPEMYVYIFCYCLFLLTHLKEIITISKTEY